MIYVYQIDTTTPSDFHEDGIICMLIHIAICVKWMVTCIVRSLFWRALSALL
jgi:hypothetical protein